MVVYHFLRKHRHKAKGRTVKYYLWTDIWFSQGLLFGGNTDAQTYKNLEFLVEGMEGDIFKLSMCVEQININ